MDPHLQLQTGRDLSVRNMLRTQPEQNKDVIWSPWKSNERL